MKLRLSIIVTLVAAIVTSSGCLYRMDILQGNRINAEVIDQLKLGMSRRQVEFLLGKPAIVDIYHPGTWHYVYFLRSGDDLSEHKRLMSLKFENDLLKDIKGDTDFATKS
ncbi:MAG: outer membrane protein assembly factor BamE [Gammaproteobacteria bacterium]|nr:outer membrane protein assembly factor BamE [Gammaproteobacteria bacterium]